MIAPHKYNRPPLFSWWWWSLSYDEHAPAVDTRPRLRPLAICGIGIVLMSVIGASSGILAAFGSLFPGTMFPYSIGILGLMPYAVIGSAGILLPLAIARGAALNAYNIRGYIWDLVVMGKYGKVTVGDLVTRYRKPDWYIINKLREWNRKGFFAGGTFVPTPVPRDMSRRTVEFQFEYARFPRNAAEAVSGISLADRRKEPHRPPTT